MREEAALHRPTYLIFSSLPRPTFRCKKKKKIDILQHKKFNAKRRENQLHSLNDHTSMNFERIAALSTASEHVDQVMKMNSSACEVDLRIICQWHDTVTKEFYCHRKGGLPPYSSQFSTWSRSKWVFGWGYPQSCLPTIPATQDPFSDLRVG
jgi:hypothetical protein